MIAKNILCESGFAEHNKNKLGIGNIDRKNVPLLSLQRTKLRA